MKNIEERKADARPAVKACSFQQQLKRRMNSLLIAFLTLTTPKRLARSDRTRRQQTHANWSGMLRCPK